jgi:hypothetical protein
MALGDPCMGESVENPTRTLDSVQVFYHVTDASAASSILQGGFRDGRGSYGTDVELQGVWLSDQRLASSEGAWGDCVLQVTFAEHVDVSEYEVREDGKPYREWLVPAELINTSAEVRLSGAIP